VPGDRRTGRSGWPARVTRTRHRCRRGPKTGPTRSQCRWGSAGAATGGRHARARRSADGRSHASTDMAPIRREPRARSQRARILEAVLPEVRSGVNVTLLHPSYAECPTRCSQTTHAIPARSHCLTASFVRHLLLKFLAQFHLCAKKLYFEVVLADCETAETYPDHARPKFCTTTEYETITWRIVLPEHKLLMSGLCNLC
jgi:hypothetical protein